MLSASIVGLGGSAANAASTPYTQDFDSMTTYDGIDFDGNVTTLVTDQPEGVGFTSGKAIKLDNQDAPWAGTKFVLPETSSFISSSNAVGFLAVYSPDSENRCFLAKLEGNGPAIERIVTVSAGWQTISVDYSSNYVAGKNYNVLALMPNIAGIGCGTWGGYKPLTTWYVDNISYPGARDASEVVVEVPRTTPSLLVNFESNDSSGYAITNFGGNSTAVVTDAPAGGSVGSVSALKVTTAGEGWAGTTFIEKSVKASLISAGNMAVKANIYSPVAGAAIMMKIESVEHPSQVVEVTRTSVAGWKTYSFDFTVGGNISTLDYPKASIFFDFFGAKTSNPWYIDDIAFNGAAGAALATPATPVVPVLVDFESPSGYTLTDFGWNGSSVVTDAPAGGSVGSASALRIVSPGECWGGTTFLSSSNSLIATGSSLVKANIYSPDAGKVIKLKLENSANGDLNKEVDVTSVAGWNTYSFNFVGFDSAVSYNKASLFTNFTCGGGSKNENPFFVDDVAFLGAVGAALGGGSVDPVPFTGNATLRLAGIDATNSVLLQGDADYWVSQGWIRAGSTFRTKLVPVGSTQQLTYAVTDSSNGSPLANTTVTLVLGKAYANSTAKLHVGAAVAGGAGTECWCGNSQATVTGVTNSQGLVTFNVVSDDVPAAAADYPGTNLAVAPSGAHLFSQITAFVNSWTQDSVDVVDFNFYKPATAVVIPQVTTRVNGLTSANSVAGSTEGWAQYYAAGLQYFERGLEVGSTTNLSYTVTANGAPYANKTVHLLLGKEYSGSTAKVSVNGQAFTGGQVTVDLTTDANGVVSFSVVNTDVSADADPYQAGNLLHPATGKHLFAQLALVGEKGNQDVLDILDLVYYRSAAATPPTVLKVRLADWNATNSFDGTHVWGDGGLGSWFDANTGYFAHYVKAGSTFNLKYSVKTAAGVNAPNGTVVNLALGSAWSGSNAKFTVNGVAVSGLTEWGANGQLDQATTTATVSGGFITVSVTSLDLDEDATVNPGSATANPDGLNPLFMQVKARVEGNFVTHNDWVNIVVTQAAAAPTITSISGTSGKNGQAIDIVGTNLADALGAPAVSLYTAATSKLPAVTTAVSVISVSADGTRMTIRSPNKTQKGNLRVTTGGGTATSATLFSASTSNTSKPAITLAASLVKEVGSTLTLTGANLGSATVVKIGTLSVAFTVLGANSVSVVIPEDVVSGSTVSATNAGGTVTTTKLIFQSPVITTATASGKVGTTVTVTGTNLKATAISFGGNKTAKAVINTPNTLTFVVPTGALTGAIKITTGGGVVYTNSFTVVPPTPTVTSFTPATGKKGVAIVTVKGKYLTGATVTVGSVAVTLSAGATDTSFKFVIPASASTGKINVTTAGGTVISATNLTVTN